MKIEYLEAEKSKYIYFTVSADEVSYYNESFESLFKYIGVNSKMGKVRYEGNAYAIIKQRTNVLLQKASSNRTKLKTSKAEIRAIRKCFGFQIMNLL